MSVTAYSIPKITTNIPWFKASMTKGIFARQIHTSVPDITLFKQLELKTPEGNQPLREQWMVCSGLTGKDFWQQDPVNLFAKYTIENTTLDGWLYCVPKPNNAVNAHEVTPLDITTFADPKGDPPFDSFCVVSLWGQEFEPTPGVKEYQQYGHVGDYICQNPDKLDDVWIVKKQFFNATYERLIDDKAPGNI